MQSMKDIANMTRGNIQAITNLCEKLLAQALNNSISTTLITQITESENDLKPKTLRNLTEVDIAILFMRYVQEIKEEIQGRYNSKILRAEIINKSNFSPADMKLHLTDGTAVYLESKFGHYTNSACGVEALSNIIGTPVFNLTPLQRQALATTVTTAGEQAALDLLEAYMVAYHTGTFQKAQNQPRVNAEKIRTLIGTSGANTAPHSIDGDYLLVKLGGRTNTRTVEFTDFNLTSSDNWGVECVINRTPGSVRLTYLFTTEDGKIMRATYNNKNSTYIGDDGIIISKSRKERRQTTNQRVDSRFGCGTGSYNVWFQDTQGA